MKNININKGNVLPAVIFTMTFIMMILSSSLAFITYNLNRTDKRIISYSEWDDFFQTIDSIVPYFTESGMEKYTAKYDGWFSLLPAELNGIETSYQIEDSKIDINHINLNILLDQNDTAKKMLIKKNPEKYIYTTNELMEYLNTDTKNNIAEYFSIYTVPNLNTCDTQKLDNFINSMHQNQYSGNYIKNKINQVRYTSNYLKYDGGKQKKSGLLIDDFIFESFKSLKWEGDNSSTPYAIFDYKGNINLNFVEPEVFKIFARGCGKKNADITTFWNRISNFRENKQSIRENDLINIFDTDWIYYQKIFGVDSNLFWIILKKENKTMRVLLRRYKDRETRIKILKYELILTKKWNKR